jgi:hypothetical protein
MTEQMTLSLRQALEDHLERMIFYQSKMNRPADFKYVSPFAFLKEHAIYKVNGRRPMHIKKGEPKQCYKNAFQVAWRHPHRFSYVEGLAISKKVGFPIDHAWVYDKLKKRFFEVTWDDGPGQILYFGVVIKLGFVISEAMESQIYGVLQNWKTGWRILKESTPKRAWRERIDDE